VQKSYVVKRPVNFADFNFFVKVGDILKHDTQNNNSLTVYRGGAIVKTLSQTVLGIKAMLMNDFISEIGTQAPAPAPKAEPTKAAVKEVPVPAPAPAKIVPKAPKKAEEPKKSYTAEEYTPAIKRGKAQGKEISADEMPDRLRKALELPTIEDETV
jgi:hypothetical protein